MSHPKDRMAALLRRCKKALINYAVLADGGDWAEHESLRVLIKDIEKALAYRQPLEPR